MRFIRKGGKIIPIRERKDGGTDKRHVSQKALAEAASRKKVSGKKVAAGAAAGAALGAAAVGTSVVKKTTHQMTAMGLEQVGKVKRSLAFGKKFGAKGALLGAAIGAIGAAIGSTYTTKQKVADKLGKYRKGKKK